MKQQICLPCPDCDLPREQVKNAWRAQFTVETGAVLLVVGAAGGVAWRRVLCKTTPKKESSVVAAFNYNTLQGGKSGTKVAASSR